jgi:hypothetical protein
MKTAQCILIIVWFMSISSLASMLYIESLHVDDVITKLQLPTNQLEIDRANMAAFVYMENTGVSTINQ